MPFADVIVELRKEKGFTQQDLANKLHITDKAVSKWENGTALPDITLVPQIANFFGVSADELLCMKEMDETEELKEYEYKGKKYVKVRNTKITPDTMFSNGTIVHPDASYWFRVEPITWIVDKKTDIAVSKNALFCGVQYNQKEVPALDFMSSDIKWFIDKFNDLLS